MLRPLLCTALLAALPAFAADPTLTTVAERSGFLQTGRYDEVIALCNAFAQRYPDAVRCTDFGTTPEGRPMKLLIVTKTGAFTPEAAKAKRLPVMLIQGGIHAGEIDGKDAGFLALRQTLDGQAAKGSLGKQVLLFVPVFNVDGHERFGRWNRPNQRGPEEMGWRTTAQNYNLNRDYVKADTPEMQSMLALMNAWDPLAYIDLHVTDGAKFEHDVSIQVEPVHTGDVPLSKTGRELRDNVIRSLAKHGSLPVDFYPSFVVTDDPSSGFDITPAPPRFSIAYASARNRFGMLVETHSWRPYPHRVKVTRNTIVALLEQLAKHGPAWQRVADEADSRTATLTGTAVPLSYRTSDKTRTVEFRGYEYTRTPSDVSGALMTRYDETKPQLWKLPLRYEVLPDTEATAPQAGYLIPAAHAGWVSAKLAQHGIEFRKLDNPLDDAQVQAFRAGKTKLSSGSTEGHQRIALEGKWQSESHDLTSGALFVPIKQPKARLVMAMLEPQAPDSLASWGSFNNAFERKEYMEDYVAEEVAREMLAKDPALRVAFEQKLKDDAAFAKDPQARLDFFYQRHTAWDARHNLYPVLRIDVAP